MILVVGGLASGKRTYARSLGFPEQDMAFDVHELARDCRDADALADELSAKALVTCCEVGGGIVPVEASERRFREQAGALSLALAQRAECVVRMVCGIPVALKGELPPARCVELVLVRHGQTPGNGERRYVGAVDQPLSREGERQAREAGPYPEVRRVYVSTLQRTHQTAALMFPEARQVVVEGIQEMDFGVFAGRSADEMVDDAQYREWVDGNCEGVCPGGESRSQLDERVCTAMERLVREALQRGERKLVVVGHGGTMMAFLDRFAKDDGRVYWQWLTGNCEGYRLLLECPEQPGLVVRRIQPWPDEPAADGSTYAPTL